MLNFIFNTVLITIRKDLKRGLINYLKNKLVIWYHNSTSYKKLNVILVKLNSLHTRVIGITQSILSRLRMEYPLVYTIICGLKQEYFKIISGNIASIHVQLLFSAGFFCSNGYYFYWLTIMVFTLNLKSWMVTNNIHKKSPLIHNSLLYILDIVYLLSLSMCINSILDSIILPFFRTSIAILKKIWDGILNMMGFKKGESSNKNNNPSPNPKKDPDIPFTGSDDKSKDKSKSGKLSNTVSEFAEANFDFACVEGANFKDKTTKFLDIQRDYSGYLSEDAKKELNQLSAKEIYKFTLNDGDGIHEFWKNKKKSNKAGWDHFLAVLKVFEANSKSIQEKLGGKKSERSLYFRKEVDICKTVYSRAYKEKEAIIKKQLANSREMDKILAENGLNVSTVIDSLTKK